MMGERDPAIEIQLNQSTLETVLETLQPLRDLARNWDVDIAACLEEYLQELTGTAIEGGLPSAALNDSTASSAGRGLNFAQAALILQNSSSVYSRKVEYLYSLVYKALDEFFRDQKNVSKASATARRKSGDVSIDDFHAFDPHVEFLLLDDVLPQDQPNHKKIDLPQSKGGEANDEIGITPSLTQTMNRTRLSLGGLSVTRRERTFQNMRTSILSSSSQRTLVNSLNQGNLRLVDGRCDIREDGVLLMPGAARSSDPKVLAKENDSRSSGFRLNKRLFADSENAPPEIENAQPFPMSEGYDDDHDDYGPGFAIDDMHIGDDVPALVDEDNFQQSNEVGVMQNRRVAFSEPPTDPAQQTRKDDPWAQLDPHQVSKNDKPFRRGRTYRLPPGIKDPPSKCATGAGTSRLGQHKMPIATDIENSRPNLIVSAFRDALRIRSDGDFDPIESFIEDPNSVFSQRGLAFGDEFAYIAEASSKRRAAEKRQRRKEMRQVQDGFARNLMPQSADLDYDEDDGDDFGAGYDFGGGDDDHDDGNALGNFGNAGIASLADAFPSRHSVDEDGEGPIYEGTAGMTFEELCRAHIQSFAKGAERYALNTRLSDRVSQWQTKLTPILEAEERRDAFDIYDYSERVVGRVQHRLNESRRESLIGKADSDVEFSAVTEHCNHHEVCRMFLASLSLANSGNLEIKSQGSSLRFGLLSSDIERPMETYLAPSAGGEIVA